MFRYRPINDNTWNELKNQEVYFASRHELNDPLDLQLNVVVRWQNEYEIVMLFNLLINTENSIRDSMREKGQVITQIEEAGKLRYKSFFIDYLKSQDLPRALLLSEVQSQLNQCFNKMDSTYRLFFIDDFFKIVEEHVNKNLDRVRVSSFSKCCKDFKMWSIYSGNHKGICIEYGEALKKGMIKRDYELFEPIDVDYGNKPYTPSLTVYGDFMELLDDGSISKHHNLKSFFQKVWAFKDLIWKDEKEIRLLKLQRTSAGVIDEHIVRFKNDSVVGIYLGALISDNDARRVKYIAQHFLNRPPVYQMKFDLKGTMTFEGVPY